MKSKFTLEITKGVVSDLVTKGGAVAHIQYSDNFLHTIQSVVEKEKAKGFKPYIGGKTMALCIDMSSFSFYRDLAKDISHQINTSSLRGYLSEDIVFDDVYITKYQPYSKDLYGEVNISTKPHRDIDCKGVVLVILLKGEASYFLGDIENANLRLETKIGECMILRTQGFVSDGTLLERPIHYVGPIGDKGFVQIGFRQYINDPTSKGPKVK